MSYTVGLIMITAVMLQLITLIASVHSTQRKTHTAITVNRLTGHNLRELRSAHVEH